MKILLFGEILWDIVNGKAHLGGAPLNLASHIAQMVDKSTILSAIGKDELGKKALTKLNNLGVITTYIIQLANKETGTVLVSLKDGQPTYEIKQGVAWDHIVLTKKQLDKISMHSWDCFCFGSLAQRSSKNQFTLQQLFKQCKFTEVFFDINLRQRYWNSAIIEQSLKQTTILKINDDEVNTVSKLLWDKVVSIEDFVSKMIDIYNIPTICVTLGAKGAMAFTTREKYFSKGEKIVVADTVGAGDSFSAAFLFTYLKTRNLQKAIENGCILGGFVASCHGAIPVEDKKYAAVINGLI